MFFKRVSFISAFFLLTACSSVTGVVRDKETLTPISSATVTIPRVNSSTTTNAVGNYKLMGAFISGDTIMVNAPGYNIYTGTIRNAQNEIMDIELVPKK